MIGGAVMDAAWHMFNPQQSKMMKLVTHCHSIITRGPDIRAKGIVVV